MRDTYHASIILVNLIITIFGDLNKLWSCFSFHKYFKDRNIPIFFADSISLLYALVVTII
jgi:hypothetical protein